MNIKSSRKYLLLIPLVVSMVMLSFFSAAYDEIIHEKHEQKFLTVQRAMNFIVSTIDRFVQANNDWDVYDYAAILVPLSIEIDETSRIHVALYDQDLTLLSDRPVDDMETSFDLSTYPEFTRAVMESDDRGELTIVVDDGIHASHEMLVCFKKIPTGDYNNKLIAVYGVSKFDIDDNFATWLVWGMVGMVSMTVLLQVWMILYILKLSDAERQVREKISNKAGDRK